MDDTFEELLKKEYEKFQFNELDKRAEQIQTVMEKWKDLHDAMDEGLPFERWLEFNHKIDGKNNSQSADLSLYDFMTKENGQKQVIKSSGATLFCSSGIAQHPENLMIYSKQKKVKEKGKEKYSVELYNAYQQPDRISIETVDANYLIPSEKEEVYKDYYEKCKKDYDNNIQPLLKKIVTAQNIGEINDIEKEEEENKTKKENFKGAAFLRHIIIMESLREGSPYYHELAWICSDTAINDTAKALKVYQEDETVLKRNAEVLKKAIEILGIEDKICEKKDDQENALKEFMKLNYFLWTVSQDIALKNNELLMDFAVPNLIFSGAPGTGKTYTVSESIKKLISSYPDQFKAYKAVQFHPSYTYQDFIEGIKPMGIREGNLDLKVVNGSFKDFCIMVRRENENFWKKHKITNRNMPSSFKNWPHYYFVVDEINRGNLSNIFGETFTLLESDYRDYDFSGEDGVYDSTENSPNSASALVETPLSEVIKNLPEEQKKQLAYKIITKKVNGVDVQEVKFGVPFNIHFIGMMNDVDRSIDSFDLAFRRRFRWESVHCDYKVIYNTLMSETHSYSSEDVSNFVKSCMRLNYYVTGTPNKTNDLREVIGAYEDPEHSLRCGQLYEFGHGIFLKIRSVATKGKITPGSKKKLFENYIEGTLREYLRQLGNEENDLDTMIKNTNDVFVKNDTESDAGSESTHEE